MNIKKEIKNQKNRYITVCPSLEETEYIYFEYEEDRRRRLVEGKRPLSMSRFLVECILGSLSDPQPEALNHG